MNSKAQVKGKLGHVVLIHIVVHQFQSSDTCYIMAKEVIPADKRIIAANFSNLCLAKKEILRYS